jgi:prolycopene isomerase
MNQAAVGKVEKVMEKYWPDLRWHTTKKEAFTSQNISAQSRASVVFGQGGECIGLGQVIGQCGPDKPNPKSPLSRLWFVGCDAGGYGCGTHQAVESGFQVAEMVAKELG